MKKKSLTNVVQYIFVECINNYYNNIFVNELSGCKNMYLKVVQHARKLPGDLIDNKSILTILMSE